MKKQNAKPAKAHKKNRNVAIVGIGMTSLSSHKEDQNQPEMIHEAVRAALADANLTLDDIDLFEINEAFSGSTVAVLKTLALDPARVNVNGGSAAIGHPIGASGCRLLVTLLHEMVRQDKKRGLVSLCLGGGEAVAMIVKR